MKKALIDPTDKARSIESWQEDRFGDYTPVFVEMENGARVAEVADAAFEVAPPLFWVDCDDEIVPDLFYYHMVEKCFLPISNVPHPKAAPTKATGEIPQVTI